MKIERGQLWQTRYTRSYLITGGKIHYLPSLVVVVEAAFPGYVVFSSAERDSGPSLAHRESFLKSHVPFDPNNGAFTRRAFRRGFDRRYFRISEKDHKAALTRMGGKPA